MKHFAHIWLALSLVVFVQQISFSQDLDLDKIVLPEDVRPKTFEDYLVQLAWKNTPINQSLFYQVELHEQEKLIAKKAWMNDLSATFNLNNISLSQIIYGDQIDVPVFFPIYNVTAGFNLGTLFGRKHFIAIAEQRRLQALTQIDQRKLELRRDVIERYQAIVNARDISEVRRQAERDIYNNYLLMSEKFKISEVSFEDFNQAASSYYASKEGSAVSEGEIAITINRLEELIGIPFEDAEKNKKRYDKKK